MLKILFITTHYRYGLLILTLLALSGWQWLQITQLGQHWQNVPQRALAAPLVDYAQQQAAVALNAQQRPRLQQIVDELVSAQLVATAQLYDNSGVLLAHSGEQNPYSRPYIRTLYSQSGSAEKEPIGFLRLQLNQTHITVTQRTVWQQLLYHLRWLLPLTLVGGLLVGYRLRARATL